MAGPHAAEARVVNARERARRQRAFRKGMEPVGICVDCGKVRPLVADHGIPVTMGGTWDEANRRGRCAKCHGIKTQRERTDPFAVLDEEGRP
jgi:5-methylcytosine-specific restriction endonuclease McrA